MNLTRLITFLRRLFLSTLSPFLFLLTSIHPWLGGLTHNGRGRGRRGRPDGGAVLWLLPSGAVQNLENLAVVSVMHVQQLVQVGRVDAGELVPQPLAGQPVRLRGRPGRAALRLWWHGGGGGVRGGLGMIG